MNFLTIVALFVRINLIDIRIQNLRVRLYYKLRKTDLMDISDRIVVFSLVSDVPLSTFDSIFAHSIHFGDFDKVPYANWPHMAKYEAENYDGMLIFS